MGESNTNPGKRMSVPAYDYTLFGEVERGPTRHAKP